MIKAIIYGLVTMLAFQTLILVIAMSLKTTMPCLDIALYFAAPLAGFVTAWIAPREKVLAGTALAVFTPVIGLVLMAVGDVLDLPRDHFGVKGTIILCILILVYNGVFCGVGALAGNFVWQRYHKFNKV